MDRQLFALSFGFLVVILATHPGWTSPLPALAVQTIPDQLGRDHQQRPSHKPEKQRLGQTFYQRDAGKD